MSQIIGPQSKFQETYLNSNARILIAGGAAGSSKSFIGLMRHLRWKDDPYYRGYCIRKNSTALMKSGGLFEQAVDLYSKVDPGIKIKLKDQKIVFSSGASVSFSHYENDKAGQELYQGIEMCGTFYDEATHADESHIWWLISRLRTTRAKMTPCIWLSCNPDPDSYLRTWVDWWLYPEGHEKYGLPDPEKNGKSRWMLRKAGELYWGNSAEELIEKYGFKEYGMNDPNQVKPYEVVCVLGTIYDNPTLMRLNPEYKSNLESLPEIEKQRLLLGNWEAREQSSTFFQRGWCEEVVSYEPTQVDKIVRAYDFAGTLKSDANPSPDYTVATKMAKMKDGTYIVLDVRRTRIRFGEWEKFIIENSILDAEEHPRHQVTILIPEDPGVGAKAATALLARSLAEAGLYTQKMRASTKKLDRFRPFSAMAQNQGIKFLKGCGHDYENNKSNENEFIYKELEAFNGERRRGENGHDDIADTMSDAFSFLASKIVIPNFIGGLQNFGAGFSGKYSHTVT